MCLELKSKRSFVATKDKVVYKHVISFHDNKFLTSFIKTLVGMGKTYESKISFNRYKQIEEGLHSYPNLSDAEQEAQHFNEVLVKCVIPAGSTYYSGTFDGRKSIASNKLKYIKVIRNYE